MKSLTFTLSALAFSVLCSNALAAEKVSVAYLPTLHGLPLFVALEEGMFKEVGLDVTATKFENPNQIIDSLVAGRSDAAPAGGAAGITALAESRFPGVLRVFALQGSSSEHGAYSDAFIVQSDSPIQSIADLKGKRVVHAPGIQWRTIARTIFQANGMDPDKDVTLTEMAIGCMPRPLSPGPRMPPLPLSLSLQLSPAPARSRRSWRTPPGKPLLNLSTLARASLPPSSCKNVRRSPGNSWKSWTWLPPR